MFYWSELLHFFSVEYLSLCPHYCGEIKYAPAGILDLCLRKTPAGKSLDYIVFKKLRFQNVLRPHKNSKLPFSNSSGLKIGSITSRCSGKEPALLPRRHGWTREDSFVSLSQSVNRPQIFVGHKLSRQLGLRPGMADDVELINGVRKNFRDN